MSTPYNTLEINRFFDSSIQSVIKTTIVDPRLRQYGRTLWSSKISNDDISITNPFTRKRRIKKIDTLDHIIVCRTTGSALRSIRTLWPYYEKITSMFEKYIISYDSNLCLLIAIPDFYLIPLSLGISNLMAYSFVKKILLQIQLEIVVHQKRELMKSQSIETITNHRLENWIGEIQELENEKSMVNTIY